jgi:small subunit ribosomal protein S16
LQIGVEKGAITQEVADKRFEAWMIEKQNKISAKQESCRNAQKEDAKQRLAKESEVNAAKAAAIAKKREEAAAAQAAAAEEVPATEEAVAETAETPAE